MKFNVIFFFVVLYFSAGTYYEQPSLLFECTFLCNAQEMDNHVSKVKFIFSPEAPVRVRAQFMCASMKYGEQSATMDGTVEMLPLYVVNLDCHH